MDMVGNNYSPIIRKTRLKRKLFLFFVFLILQGCKYTPPKYGIEFNKTREEIGLPVLLENWDHKKTIEKGYSTWVNPNYDREKPYYDRKPYYHEKTVVYNKDTILWEANTYIGLQKFTTIDGTFKEELNIKYYFVKNEDNKIRWEYNLFTAIKSDNGYYSMSTINITKEEADAILVSWGLPYDQCPGHTGVADTEIP